MGSPQFDLLCPISQTENNDRMGLHLLETPWNCATQYEALFENRFISLKIYPNYKLYNEKKDLVVHKIFKLPSILGAINVPMTSIILHTWQFIIFDEVPVNRGTSHLRWIIK